MIKRLAPVLLVVVVSMVVVAAPSARSAEEAVDPLQRAVAAARDRVYPALVNIGVIARQFIGGRAIRMPGQGSGVIVSPAGHVLTNFHVAEEATQLACTLPSGERIDADVITHDPLTDLSVLKLRLHERDDATKPIPFASIGDSDALSVGDRVLALGNPRGLSSSLTLGVVANTNRVFKSFTGSAIQTLELSEGQPTGLFTRFIQHDALIQPGNSGGPLVNMKGEVVGINELAGGGMSFAIPSNLAKQVLNQALTFGRVDRGWMGVTVLPSRAIDRDEGALVASVLPGHPMAQAGVKAGDVLVELAGEPVHVRQFEDVPTFYAAIADLPIGSHKKVAFLRDGERHEVQVEVAKMERYLGEERTFHRWGVTAMGITGPMAFSRYYPDTRGVVITGMRPGKPPEVARPSLGRGDVVVEVGGKPVEGLDGFAALQKEFGRKKDLLVRFRRGRRDMVTALDMTRRPPRRRGSELAKAWLGVETQVMTPEVARALGMPERKGFRVTWVLPGTEAEKAGLEAGDVITALDDEKLEAWRLQDAELLRRKIEDLDIGSEVTLAVVRAGKDMMKVDVTLEETPETSADVKTEKDEILEYGVRELTYRDRVNRHWPLDLAGVIVASVENGGWANVAGLQAGDLILTIQDRPVDSIKAFKAETKRLAGEKPRRVKIFVRRGRSTNFVFIQPEWPQD